MWTRFIFFSQNQDTSCYKKQVSSLLHLFCIWALWLHYIYWNKLSKWLCMWCLAWYLQQGLRRGNGQGQLAGQKQRQLLQPSQSKPIPCMGCCCLYPLTPCVLLCLVLAPTHRMPQQRMATSYWKRPEKMLVSIKVFKNSNKLKKYVLKLKFTGVLEMDSTYH